MAPQVGNINVDLLVHKRSALRNQAPQPQQLEYGEIAVNYFVDEQQRDWPFLSIKSTDGQIRRFIFDPQEVLPGVDMRLTGGFNATTPPPPQPFEGQTVINTGTGPIDPGWGVTLIGNPSLRGGELLVFNSGAWSLLTYIPPDASTTVRGIVELADDVETITGTDGVRAVTPKGLAALTSTTTRRGLIELATNTETNAGISAVLAVSPAALANRQASEVLTGLVELATDAEVIAGTDTERAVTPAGLASLTATDARRGLIEIATDAETLARTADDLAVTPSGVAAALDEVDVTAVAPVTVTQTDRAFEIEVPLVTQATAGLASAADKTKLDELENVSTRRRQR